VFVADVINPGADYRWDMEWHESFLSTQRTLAYLRLRSWSAHMGPVEMAPAHPRRLRKLQVLQASRIPCRELMPGEWQCMIAILSP